MRRRQLDQLAEKWRRRLRIQDWRVRIRRTWVAGWPDTEGDCEIEHYTRQAVVTVDPRSQQPERILLHELVHLATSPLVVNGCPEQVEELVVWGVTDALLDSERGE